MTPMLGVVHLSPLGILAIGGAGLFAGMINTIVGSGSLITFPTLVALGYSPLVANVSNNVGLIFGNVSGVHGYRHELADQGPRIKSLAPWSAAGGLTGAGLLLAHPSAFHAIVPWLVVLAIVMVIVQPRLAKALAARGERHHTGGVTLRIGIFLTGVYGGYFGAAQGVILIALLAISLDEKMQPLVGLKNVLAAVVNGLAGILFCFLAPVAFAAALIIAIASTIGGQVGAKVGRRLPPQVLRATIVTVGVAVVVKLLAFS